MSTFSLPDLGEGLNEAEIVAWHVSEGDHVVADQPLVSVETDKAVVEVPSPQSGHIEKLHGMAGDLITVGNPLVDFKEAQSADTGAIVGDLPQETDLVSDFETPLRQGQSAGVMATPAVRALARKLDVDLSMVSASGSNNTITRADVERAAKSLDDAGPAESLRGMRRAMEQRMAAAHAEVVRAGVSDEADIEVWESAEDVTIRLVRAIIAAITAEPSLNVWYDSKNRERRLLKRIDVGLAVDTDDGLIVPVLRNVGERTSADLRAGLDRLRADVSSRIVPPDELRGATISLSNFGMIGGRFANLVVVPPQVAIIGAGRIEKRVVVGENGPEIRRSLPVMITFDHRVVTGGEAARFLVALKQDLEKPM